jgi:uncharacterized membrane protein SpoIIM required for sporulation
MTPLQFEADYRALWDELEAAVGQVAGPRPLLRRKSADKPAQAVDPARLAALYRATCEHLALARAREYPVHLTQRLEDLTERAHQIVYRPPRQAAARLGRLFLVDVPQAVRAHRLTMWIATLLFAGPLLVLGLVTYFDPGFVLTLHDADSVREYDRMYGGSGDEPMGRQRDADTDWEMFGFYIRNNLGVAFQCFAGGMLFGLGSIFFIAYNGAIGGAVAGYLTARGHGENFYSFVVTHGAFELTAIVMSGAAGLSLGFALLAPGRLGRVQALRQAAAAAVPLIYGVIAMLVIAAAVEAFWSSSRWVTPQVKYGVGGACWLLVLAYLGWQGRPRTAKAGDAG